MSTAGTERGVLTASATTTSWGLMARCIKGARRVVPVPIVVGTTAALLACATWEDSTWMATRPILALLLSAKRSLAYSASCEGATHVPSSAVTATWRPRRVHVLMQPGNMPLCDESVASFLCNLATYGWMHLAPRERCDPPMARTSYSHRLHLSTSRVSSPLDPP